MSFFHTFFTQQKSAIAGAAKRGFTRQNFSKKNVGGFSLIELVVVFGIMSIVTGVVLYNYQTFNSTTLVTNYAYEVAFAVKEAQVYGLSVLGGGTSSTFQRGYGIHFDSQSTTGSPASFVLFADLPDPATPSSPVGNGFYDSSEAPEVKKYTFAGNYKVQKFCGFKPGLPITGVCGSTTAGETTRSLDITFVRPNPDAVINMAQNGTALYTNLSSAEITLVSPVGNTKKIVIYSTGQISIPQLAIPSATPSPSGSPTPTPSPTMSPSPTP